MNFKMEKGMNYKLNFFRRFNLSSLVNALTKVS